MPKRDLLSSSSSSSPTSANESSPVLKTSYNTHKKVRVGNTYHPVDLDMVMIMKKLDALEAGQTDIKRSFENKFDKFSGTFRKLEERIDQLDRMSREKNLILYGLQDSEKENWEYTTDLVIEFFKKQLGIENSGIDVADRLGKFKSGHSRPIRIKFSRVYDKRVAMKEKKRLADPFFLNADLNSADRQNNALLREKKKEVLAADSKLKCSIGRGRLICTNEQGVKVRNFYVKDKELLDHANMVMETL